MRSAALCFLLLTNSLVAAPAAAPQYGSDPIPPSWSRTPGQTPAPNVKTPEGAETPQQRMERVQRTQLNQRRQQQLMTDAARLALLSKELQQELDKANGETLPAASFKKVDDILKLAKSVKDKMRPL